MMCDDLTMNEEYVEAGPETSEKNKKSGFKPFWHLINN